MTDLRVRSYGRPSYRGDCCSRLSGGFSPMGQQPRGGSVSRRWCLRLLPVSRCLPPVPFNWFEFVRFVPFFLMRSLLGGVDVAWRAFHPGMPIAPEFIEYPLRLPPGLARVFMANTVSLLPGTMSTEIGENCLTVHVLDGRKDVVFGARGAWNKAWPGCSVYS